MSHNTVQPTQFWSDARPSRTEKRKQLSSWRRPSFGAISVWRNDGTCKYIVTFDQAKFNTRRINVNWFWIGQSHPIVFSAWNCIFHRAEISSRGKPESTEKHPTVVILKHAHIVKVANTMSLNELNGLGRNYVILFSHRAISIYYHSLPTIFCFVDNCTW